MSGRTRRRSFGKHSASPIRRKSPVKYRKKHPLHLCSPEDRTSLIHLQHKLKEICSHGSAENIAFSIDFNQTAARAGVRGKVPRLAYSEFRDLMNRHIKKITPHGVESLFRLCDVSEKGYVSLNCLFELLSFTATEEIWRKSFHHHVEVDRSTCGREIAAEVNSTTVEPEKLLWPFPTRSKDEEELNNGLIDKKSEKKNKNFDLFQWKKEQLRISEVDQKEKKELSIPE
eukprot:g473.t1